MRNECDIIKDLLPSYADEICSEATREWVEQHLAECPQCKETAELLKNTEFTAEGLEQKGLDAVRKVKQRTILQSVLSAGLCVALLCLVSLVFNSGMLELPFNTFYVELPLWFGYMALIAMAATWLAGLNQTRWRRMDKWDNIVLVAVLLVTGYSTILTCYAFSVLSSGDTVFGIAVEKAGPFLMWHIVAAVVLSLAGYVVWQVRTIKSGRSSSLISNICLSGLFLAMAECAIMQRLSSPELAMKILTKEVLLTAGIGLVGILVFLFLDRWQQSRER